MTVSGAEFSSDRKYRYRLWRTWSDSLPRIAFIMLNPSTADETEDDPTITRCIRRATMMGYGGVTIVNLFALRGTDPKALYEADDPIGSENDRHIREVATNCGRVICGWGQHGKLLERGKQVRDLLLKTGSQALALKLNKDGSPAHPLYIGYDVLPFKFPKEQ